MGIIYNVAINASGTGLIAGLAASRPYGAFVAPNGVLTALQGLPTGEGFLDGIALDRSGYALVGGESDGAPFLALAAPNGQLTYLNDLPGNGSINSISSAGLEQIISAYR
jgi:hypothetical protein